MKDLPEEQRVFISTTDLTDENSSESESTLCLNDDMSIGLLKRPKTGGLNAELRSSVKNDIRRDISMWKIIQMNGPEWIYLVFGVLGAAIHGISFPIGAIVFGETMGLLDQNLKEDVLHLTNNLALVNISHLHHQFACFSRVKKSS